MTTNWKTVRVFISSTFRDMQAERDHLVRFVFPRLREQLLPRRIHLVDVDLRWGVTSEQDASEVCLEIINECRPRFLCMLGGRYGWVPLGKTRSITADEVHFGVLDHTLTDRGFAYFYFRNEADTAAMVETTSGELREPQGSDNQNKLAELKQAIIAAGMNPFIYPAQWDHESRRLTGLKKFGDRVYDDLLGSMTSDPELRDRFATDTAAQLDEFAEENAAMEAFVEERSERFVLGSREAVLNELLAHANATGGDGYVCLTGAPGSGKSALLAHLYRALSAPLSSSQSAIRNSQSEIVIVPHFVGASPGSTDVRRTLRRLCHELKAGCPEITDDFPDDPEKLRVAFPDFLRQACATKRVVILLDAVNQFGAASPFSGLYWLPEDLPANARIILSALDGPALDELRHRPRKPHEIELQPLTADDGEAIIEQFRKRYRKRFEPEQRASLLSKADAGTPLYVLAALEELRTLGTYEEITQRITALPPTAHELFAWILKRLENDDGFRDASGRRVGHELVSRFAALLGASRYGLSQRELADLLAPGDADTDPAIEADPQGNVAALLHLLRPYLMRRGELLDLFHSQFRKAVEAQYLFDDQARRTTHVTLAEYFQAKGWQNLRSLSELPYHQTRALMRSELGATLCSLDFVEAKCQHGMIRNLILDFARADNEDPDGRPDLAQWREWKQFASSRAAAIEEHVDAYPAIVFQEAFNSSRKGTVSQAANARLGRSKGPDLWFERVNRPISPAPRTSSFVLTGHESPVRAVKGSPDGSVVVSGAANGTLRVWDATTGACLRTLEGHTGAITCLQFINSAQALSASADGTLRVWDILTGDCVQTLAGHSRAVKSMALLSDGRVASASSDATVRCWDLLTGQCVFVCRGHEKAVNSIAILVDGKLASGSDDCTVRIWEESTGRCVECVTGQESLVLHVTALPGGGLVSSAVDGTLLVWEPKVPTGYRTFKGHKGPVMKTALLGEDRVVSGGFDSTLRVWSLKTGACLQVLTGHRDPVADFLVLGAGTLVSASHDRSIRLWRCADGQAAGVLMGHRSWVETLALLPGQRLVSGSEDHTVRIWNLDALQASDGDLDVGHTSTPAIVDARAIDLALLENPTLALIHTVNPDQFQRWDLVAGSCREIVDRTSGAWDYFSSVARKHQEGGTDGRRIALTHEWTIELSAYRASEEGTLGVGCFRAKWHQTGFKEYQPIPLAIYPLNSFPTVYVFNGDRTIAFDKLSREAHVLRLHGFVENPPMREQRDGRVKAVLVRIRRFTHGLLTGLSHDKAGFKHSDSLCEDALVACKVCRALALAVWDDCHVFYSRSEGGCPGTCEFRPVSEKGARRLSSLSEDEFLKRIYHLLNTTGIMKIHAGLQPLLNEIKLRLNLAGSPPLTIFEDRQTLDVEAALSLLREGALPAVPITTRSFIEGEYYALQDKWGCRVLKKGTLEDISSILRKNLLRDRGLPRFEGFSATAILDQSCAQLYSQFKPHPLQIFATVTAYRIWWTSRAVYVCGSRDFLD